MLRLPAWCSLRAEKLLAAIADVESAFGADLGPRKEPIWVARLRADEKYKAHPDDAIEELASSHGAFQCLGIVAVELGFASGCVPLRDAFRLHEVAVFYACRYLNRRVFQRGSQLDVLQSQAGETLEGAVRIIGDAYNSGSAADGKVPTDYCDKLWLAYESRMGEG